MVAIVVCSYVVKIERNDRIFNTKEKRLQRFHPFSQAKGWEVGCGKVGGLLTRVSGSRKFVRKQSVFLQKSSHLMYMECSKQS